jgi:hypothetical protein
VRAVAVKDIDWLVRFIPWLRETANLRSASVVMAAEAAHALLAAGIPGYTRVLSRLPLQRADEPAEFLAYWINRFGRNVPSGVKRGLSDAMQTLYTERAALKYDGTGQPWRMGDVIELVHPTPSTPRQNVLYEYLLTHRHRPDVGMSAGAALTLPMIHHRLLLQAVEPEQRAAWLASMTPNDLHAAGATWEWLGGWLGGAWTAQAWEKVIPSMGYMALLRNLRGFDNARVSDSVAKQVCDRIADPEEVARSRQLPLRFYSAYRATAEAGSVRWAWALEQALNHSMVNVPSLPGRTLVLVDRSGSMWSSLSKRSELARAEGAALFGTVIAKRAEHADLVEFGTTSNRVPFTKTAAVLPTLNLFTSLGGTYTDAAIRTWFKGQDRVVIVTDEQAADSGRNLPVPPKTPVYTWNLAGYRAGHGVSGMGRRHTFGGLNDAAFGMIPLLEREPGRWPF